MAVVDLYRPSFTYSKSPEDIVHMYRTRRMSRGPMIERAMEIRDTYNGDLAVPLFELNKDERAAVPNLVGQGIDQTGMRIASTVPNVFCPPTRPGIKSSEFNATSRRRAILAWWEVNNMQLKMRRRARWLLGYASSPVVIRPSLKYGCPKWEIRDPLSCYPAPSIDPDDIEPADCIFAFTRPYSWIVANYPQAASEIKRPKNCRGDDAITIIEYVDDEQITLLALSNHVMANEPALINGDTNKAIPATPSIDRTDWIGLHKIVTLEQLPNRANICTAIVPGRITLDRQQGQYDGIVGMYQAQAMLFALEFRAVAQGVWPDTWLVGRQNEDPKVITQANGRQGVIGKVSGGDIKTLVENPGYKTDSTIDRLERNQRVTAGIPPEFGGESGSNIRTGRRGDSILSAVVDFPIQEAQELFAASRTAENKRAIAIDLNYFGSTAKTFYLYSGNSRSQSRLDYTPEKIFTETDRNIVSYPFAGTDINNLIIGIGQAVGIGIMSQETAMELYPQIDDVEIERDRLTSEALGRALQSSLEQMAASGGIPPADIARIKMLVKSDQMELEDAVTQVQQEAQERQAQQVPASDPLAQPGLAQPGAGAEASAIPEVQPSLEAFASQLRALRPGASQARIAENELAAQGAM